MNITNTQKTTAQSLEEKTAEALFVFSELSKYTKTDIQELSSHERNRFLLLALQYKYLKTDPDLEKTIKKFEEQFNITPTIQTKIDNIAKQTIAAKEMDEINYFRVLNRLTAEEQRFKSEFLKMIATHPEQIFDDPKKAVRAVEMGILRPDTVMNDGTQYHEWILKDANRLKKTAEALQKEASKLRIELQAFKKDWRTLSSEQKRYFIQQALEKKIPIPPHLIEDIRIQGQGKPLSDEDKRDVDKLVEEHKKLNERIKATIEEAGKFKEKCKNRTELNKAMSQKHPNMKEEEQKNIKESDKTNKTTEKIAEEVSSSDWNIFTQSRQGQSNTPNKRSNNSRGATATLREFAHVAQSQPANQALNNSLGAPATLVDSAQSEQVNIKNMKSLSK